VSGDAVQVAKAVVQHLVGAFRMAVISAVAVDARALHKRIVNFLVSLRTLLQVETVPDRTSISRFNLVPRARSGKACEP
jgi:hypothetical protein